MNDAIATASIPADGLRDRWNRIADTLSGLINHALLALIDRIAIGAVTSMIAKLTPLSSTTTPSLRLLRSGKAFRSPSPWPRQ